MVKMLKKILTTLLIILLFVAVVGVVNLKSRTSPPTVAKSEVIVLGDGLHPFPGYNMSYAPYFYDANVKEMQTQLNHYSDATYCGTPDGYFGSRTLTAVKNFQSMEGLTVDGIVGQITWDRLFYNY